jgi:hypothetical protein
MKKRTIKFISKDPTKFGMVHSEVVITFDSYLSDESAISMFCDNISHMRRSNAFPESELVEE